MEYDIVFGKGGNGRVKKTRFPDGESLITVLNLVEGKMVLYVTEGKMREIKSGLGCMDWIFTISACVQNGAKRVDVVINFEHLNKLAKKFVEGVGASVVIDRNEKKARQSRIENHKLKFGVPVKRTKGE